MLNRNPSLGASFPQDLIDPRVVIQSFADHTVGEDARIVSLRRFRLLSPAGDGGEQGDEKEGARQPGDCPPNPVAAGGWLRTHDDCSVMRRIDWLWYPLLLAGLAGFDPPIQPGFPI